MYVKYIYTVPGHTVVPDGMRNGPDRPSRPSRSPSPRRAKNSAMCGTGMLPESPSTNTLRAFDQHRLCSIGRRRPRPRATSPLTRRARRLRPACAPPLHAGCQPSSGGRRASNPARRLARGRRLAQARDVVPKCLITEVPVDVPVMTMALELDRNDSTACRSARP